MTLDNQSKKSYDHQCSVLFQDLKIHGSGTEIHCVSYSPLMHYPSNQLPVALNSD